MLELIICDLLTKIIPFTSQTSKRCQNYWGSNNHFCSPKFGIGGATAPPHVQPCPHNGLAPNLIRSHIELAPNIFTVYNGS